MLDVSILCCDVTSLNGDATDLCGDVTSVYIMKSLVLQCFSKVKSLEPSNIQGQHNLCVVYVEKGELDLAKSCLAAIMAAAPTEQYVQQHLAIVRQRLADKRRPT